MLQIWLRCTRGMGLCCPRNWGICDCWLVIKIQYLSSISFFLLIELIVLKGWVNCRKSAYYFHHFFVVVVVKVHVIEWFCFEKFNKSFALKKINYIFTKITIDKNRFDKICKIVLKSKWKSVEFVFFFLKMLPLHKYRIEIIEFPSTRSVWNNDQTLEYLCCRIAIKCI